VSVNAKVLIIQCRRSDLRTGQFGPRRNNPQPAMEETSARGRL